jgi:2-isopropylmalate synthase
MSATLSDIEIGATEPKSSDTNDLRHPPLSNQIIFFDPTMRDGEKARGCSMTTQERLALAHALDDLGVNVIETGFAIASEGDFAAISTICQAVRKPRVASLARAKREDIEMAARSIPFADRARIQVFIASSDLHLEYKLKISRQEALDVVSQSVRLARSFVDDVEFSPEDSTRSDRDFLVEMVRVAIEAGATTINMPDTVGYSTPGEHGQMFREVRSAFWLSTSKASFFLRIATTISALL